MTDYQTDALTPDHVDLTRPLSDDMKTWLLNRNRHDLLEENARHLRRGEPAPDATDTTEPPPEDEDDYDNWTLAELQTEAGERALTKSGTKADLIARLRENDAAEE